MKEFTAAGVRWQDKTYYSRNDKVKVPTMYYGNVSNIVITITCGHIYHRPNWILFCESLGLREKVLTASNAQEAAEQAVKICKDEIEKIYNSFSNI